MKTTTNKAIETTDITWTTTDLTAARIDTILGAGSAARVLAQPNAADHCAARAAGYWQANEREYHAAYRSLGRIATLA